MCWRDGAWPARVRGRVHARSGASRRVLGVVGVSGHGAVPALQGSSPTRASVGGSWGARGSQGTWSAWPEVREERGACPWPAWHGMAMLGLVQGTREGAWCWKGTRGQGRVY